MKNIIKQLMQIAIYSLLVFISPVKGEIDLKKDNITQSFYFKNIVIHDVENYEPKVHEEYKVIIQEIDKSKKSMNSSQINNPPVLGKILWTITSDQLPMTKEICFEADVQLCSEYKPLSFRGNIGACSSLCLTYGPHYLIYDEKNDIVYVSNHIGVGGTAGVQTMIFAVNIRTKEIKRLTFGWDPTTASLSPSGTYLTLNSGGISVINTHTGENFFFKEPTITKAAKLETVYVSYFNIKWLDDHTLQFEKEERKDKFSFDHPTYTVKKILDIRTRTTKIVN